MKSKALLTAVLLAATNFAWANGGLSVDNVEQAYIGKYFVGPTSNGEASSAKLISGPSYNGKTFVGPSSRGETSNDKLISGPSYNGKTFVGPSVHGMS